MYIDYTNALYLTFQVSVHIVTLAKIKLYKYATHGVYFPYFANNANNNCEMQKGMNYT